MQEWLRRVALSAFAPLDAEDVRTENRRDCVTICGISTINARGRAGPG